MRAWSWLMLLAFKLPGLAQPSPQTAWSNVYGTDFLDVPSKVVQSTSGALLTIGFIKPQEGADACPTLMKISAATGAWQAAVTYPDYGYGTLRDLIELPDHGLMLLGMVELTGHDDYDILLLRTDSSGTRLWSRLLGDSTQEAAASFVRLADGGYLIAGSAGPSESEQDLLVMRTDSAGQVLTRFTYGGGDPIYATKIRATADGNYAVAGATQSFSAGGHDGYLLKVNADGDTLWARTFGSSGEDEFSDITCLSDGSILCAGSTDFSGEYQVYLVKVDANGNEIWSTQVASETATFTQWILPAAQGGFVIAGGARQTTDIEAGYLLRVDAAGQLLWDCLYSRNDYQWFGSGLQMADGGFVLCGSTIETHGDYTSNDWWLVKTGPDPILDVPLAGAALPLEFALSAYPNPFNATTTLALDLPQTGPVRVTLVDALGRQAQTFDFPTLAAGRQELRVDGSPLASGVYFARVTAGAFTATRKLVLIK